jgi:hypothetical protein
MNKTLINAALATVAGAVLLYSWSHDDRLPAPTRAAVVPLNPAALPGGASGKAGNGGNTGNIASILPATDRQTNEGQLSPFAAAAPNAKPASGTAGKPALAPEPETVPPEEGARRKKMQQLGYLVPPDYYQKSLATLRQLAASGDAYAMVHLGEKYYFELNGQPNNPDYQSGVDYPAAAKQAFSGALAAGNIRSAGIIAELYLQENNPIDAYTWHLLSKRLGDSISAEWFEKTTLFANLSQAQKQAGQGRLPNLIESVNQLALQAKRPALL